MQSYSQIGSMSEFEILETFIELFWDGYMWCPKCGNLKIYYMSRKDEFKCKRCLKHFTIKNDTVFYRSKLPLRKCLELVALFCEKKNALQISTIMKIQYATAYKLRKKLEANEYPI